MPCFSSVINCHVGRLEEYGTVVILVVLDDPY